MKHISNKGNILASLIMSLALATPISATAEGQLVIPNVNEVQPAYGSVELLLNSCSNVMDNDEDFADQVNDARKYLPTGTCSDPKLVNKLFKARFLQYSMIDNVPDPWNFDKEIAEQNKTIAECKDTECLNKALDNIINKLAPLYLNPSKADTDKGNAKSLCDGDFDADSTKRYTSVIGKLIRYLDSGNDRCAGYGYDNEDDNGKVVHYLDVDYSTCKSKVGDLLVAQCTINLTSNQVNSPTWIYKLEQNEKPKELFNSNDGPYYELSTSCNGAPDLSTNARYNMGEHLITFYRYDGDQYQMVYSYMEEYIGDDSNGNSMMIATAIEEGKHEINCHIKQ